MAAHCSRGVRLAALGPPLRHPVRLTVAEPRRRGGRVDGEVLLVDRFGNLLTSLRGRELPGPADRGVLRIGGARVRGLVGTYAERPRRALGALIDSSGRVEVFVREGSARRRLGLGPGAPVSWRASGSASLRLRRRRRRVARGLALFEAEPVDAAASVPVVAGAALGVGSPLDFFSASIPFFRPAEG